MTQIPLAGGAVDISTQDAQTIVDATDEAADVSAEAARAVAAEATKVTLVAAPGTASSTGVAGQIAYDATHIYVCVATNTWCRATIATF